MKKFIFIILIFPLFFCLTGCKQAKQELKLSDYIMLSLDSNNGEITQSIDFSVNSNVLSQQDPKDEVFSFQKALINEISKLRDEFLFTFAIKYMQNPNEEFKINKGVVLTNVVYSSKSDSVGFDIIFPSSSAWNYYHSSIDSDEKPNNGNIFYKKIVSSSEFPFSTLINLNDKTMTVGERYKEFYISASKGLKIENYVKNNYNPDFLYNYSVSSDRLHTNCDYYFLDEKGQSHYVWQKNQSNLNIDNNIEIYIIYINYDWCYFFAIMFVLTGTVVSLLVYYVKKKKLN